MSIVGNKHFPFQLAEYFRGHGLEIGSGKDHFCGNARKTCNIIGDIPSGVDQCVERISDLHAIMMIDSYLRDAMIICVSTSRLYINNRVHLTTFKMSK